MEDFERRIGELERKCGDLETTKERHSERIKEIEKKLLNDWNRFNQIECDISTLRTEVSRTTRLVEDMVNDIKKLNEEMALRDAHVSKAMKRQTKWLIVTVCISVVALVYGTIQNGNTASAISTLVTTLAKIGLVA